MRSRPFIVFWGATAAAVLFLGAAWSTMGHFGSGSRRGEDLLVLAVSLAGLVVTSFVAGRIALVTARIQRLAGRSGAPGDEDSAQDAGASPAARARPARSQLR